jgi:hypothetical protein
MVGATPQPIIKTVTSPAAALFGRAVGQAVSPCCGVAVPAGGSPPSSASVPSSRRSGLATTGLQGASHEDVADAIDCAPSTAAKHLRKAESELISAVVGSAV